MILATTMPFRAIAPVTATLLPCPPLTWVFCTRDDSYPSRRQRFRQFQLLRPMGKHRLSSQGASAYIRTSQAGIRAGVFAEDNAMDLKCANALLAGEDQKGDLEPKSRANFGILKDRVCDKR